MRLDAAGYPEGREPPMRRKRRWLSGGLIVPDEARCHGLSGGPGPPMRLERRPGNPASKVLPMRLWCRPGTPASKVLPMRLWCRPGTPVSELLPMRP